MTWVNAYVRWRGEFEAILDPRLYRIEWVDGLLANGRAQLFASPNAAVVTELKTYPTGAIEVHGLLAAGDITEIRDIIRPQLEAFGRENGAIGVLVESREGWSRLLRGHGYEPYQTSVRKEL